MFTFPQSLVYVVKFHFAKDTQSCCLHMIGRWKLAELHLWAQLWGKIPLQSEKSIQPLENQPLCLLIAPIPKQGVFINFCSLATSLMREPTLCKLKCQTWVDEDVCVNTALSQSPISTNTHRPGAGPIHHRFQ